MATLKDDGGPAFPPQDRVLVVQSTSPEDLKRMADVLARYRELVSGMSLRDYFAAKALSGMLASDSSVDRTRVNKLKWASVAYEFADAMLQAREQS